MNPLCVVKSFDIFKNKASTMFVTLNLKLIKPFPLNQWMKAFDACVVIRIMHFWITSLHLFSCFNISICFVMAPSVWVDNQWLFIFLSVFAFSTVFITNSSSIVRDNYQAIILRENKSMIVERYMKPSLVQMYVMSVRQTASGRLGLNFCFRRFFSFIESSFTLGTACHFFHINTYGSLRSVSVARK